MADGQVQKKGSGIVLKTLAFLIAAGALIYKIIVSVEYFDKIEFHWGGTLIVYFGLYFTSIATIVSVFLRGKASFVVSICMLYVSALLIFADIFSKVGFIVSLDDRPMHTLGIFWLVNVLNLIASALVMTAGFRSVSKRKKSA